MNGWIALCALALALVGCGKQIGDECESATECISTDTDRICLTQTGEGFPKGYCSQFNCSPDSCPEEAACVAYRRTLAGGECADQSNRSRLERTYCMLRCSDDSDCRSGYKCLAADGDNPLGATVIDAKAEVKICTLDYVVPEQRPRRASEVCEVEIFNQTDAEVSTQTGTDAALTEGGVDAVAPQSSEDANASAASVDR
jgi:hypothetical protein